MGVLMITRLATLTSSAPYDREVARWERVKLFHRLTPDDYASSSHNTLTLAYQLSHATSASALVVIQAERA
jgi:hypothetical protein